MGARLIRYCCGKQLNRFLIRDLHHKLDLLCNLLLSSIIDDKIRPPPSFSLPPPQQNSSLPPPPPSKEKFRPPTSFWTIRTLRSCNHTCNNLARIPVVRKNSGFDAGVFRPPGSFLTIQTQVVCECITCYQMHKW